MKQKKEKKLLYFLSFIDFMMMNSKIPFLFSHNSQIKFSQNLIMMI